MVVGLFAQEEGAGSPPMTMPPFKRRPFNLKLKYARESLSSEIESGHWKAGINFIETEETLNGTHP